jgi:para-nitrobenzyl esterase
MSYSLSRSISKTKTGATLLLTALAAMLLISCSGSSSSNGPTVAPVVQTPLGPVQGLVRNGANEYRGMPYALAPTGNLRWALPQPVTAAWSSVFQAYNFGPACPQKARFGVTEASDNEDCLSINVSVPGDIKAGEKLPVLFWIHGGAFVGGSSNLYRLDKLAREGRLIVVSANYRLGALGFMPNSAFASNGYNGNYGLEDQRLAMKWVQDNIESFGGDKTNVTIAGESAGAGSICMHLASPDQLVSQSQVKVKDLFQKAITQSAGCMQPLPTVIEGEAKASASIQAALCPASKNPTNADVLACMRLQPVAQLLDQQQAYADSHSTDVTAFSPVIGDRTVPLSFKDAAAADKLVNVPMIMGGTKSELVLYAGYFWQSGQQINASTIPEWLAAFYKDPAPAGGIAAITSYPAYAGLLSSDSNVVAETYGQVLSDYNPSLGINNCLYLRSSDVILNTPSRNKPIYQFEFADAAAPVCGVGIADPCPPFPMGPVHSSELNYLFPNLSNNSKINAPDLAPASQQLANQMVAYWTSFAYTGSPEVTGLPNWPQYTGKTVPFGGASVMLLDPNNVKAYNSDIQHNCSAFWSGQYPSRLQ